MSATFWAVLIRAINWLTRWLIGALDPTHGQAVEVAEAGAWVAAEPTTSIDAAMTTAKPATRTILNTDDRITLATTPPDARALPSRCHHAVRRCAALGSQALGSHCRPCTAGQIEH